VNVVAADRPLDREDEHAGGERANQPRGGKEGLLALRERLAGSRREREQSGVSVAAEGEPCNEPVPCARMEGEFERGSLTGSHQCPASSGRGLRRRRPAVRTACDPYEEDEEGSGCSDEQVPPPSARQDPGFATAGEECQECGKKSTSSHQPLDSELLSEVPDSRARRSRGVALSTKSNMTQKRHFIETRWNVASLRMPTAPDNGQRSPRKLLRAVVARLFGRRP
jgi:hypothetical protein